METQSHGSKSSDTRRYDRRDAHVLSFFHFFYAKTEDIDGYNKTGKTEAPIGQLTEALGGQISYNDSDHTAKVTFDNGNNGQKTFTYDTSGTGTVMVNLTDFVDYFKGKGIYKYDYKLNDGKAVVNVKLNDSIVLKPATNPLAPPSSKSSCSICAPVTPDPVRTNGSDKAASASGKDGKVYALAASDSGPHAGRLTDEQQKANAQYIYNYLTDKGWSINAISALLGNMDQESKLNPGSWQNWHEIDKGDGYGLVQWTPAGGKFLHWMGDIKPEQLDEMAKDDPKQLMDKQLEYLLLNIQPGGGEWISKLSLRYDSPFQMSYDEFIHSDKDIGQLTLVFHGTFERSADSKKVLQDRMNYAENLELFILMFKSLLSIPITTWTRTIIHRCVR